MDMKTRQDKANEIRDLVTQINARVSELDEDGYEITFRGYNKTIVGKITDLSIEKITKL